MNDLQKIREEIDAIDAQLVTLFRRRMEIAADVAAAKRLQGKPVHDPARELAILDRVSKQAGEEYASETRALYSLLFNLSKARQRTLLGDMPQVHSTAQSQQDSSFSESAATPLLSPAAPSWTRTTPHDLNVAVVGLGLIGGSLYKAACNAGYAVTGYDKDDVLHLEQTDILLLALPAAVLVDWFSKHADSLKEGAIVVDTCGVKTAICRELQPMVPIGRTFVGGHPMAGKEHSGFAYADGGLFKGASMILTPYVDAHPQVLDRLETFFGTLGFSRVLTTSPEHHDRMIAFTSHLSHVIAAAYSQDPLVREASGYAAGSYANMTRIASMDPASWETLFSANSLHLLPVLEDFIDRLQAFRTALSKHDSDAIRSFIQAGADGKASDGVQRPTAAAPTVQTTDAFGNYLKLTISGSSHAPSIGMHLENFPRGFTVDLPKLQAFLERRAPGRDPLSTARKEPDIPVFLSGLDKGVTTGEKINALIRNTDTRPQDYGKTRTIPRPGHADYPQWARTGVIHSGGGANSGRMTAPMCIAGGICLQWLEKRHIMISAVLASVGGQTEKLDDAILAAKHDGDSVGGCIDITVTGLPVGLGGPMFAGLESELSAALFAIPGVKGVSFGDGVDLATMRGSQANDPFEIHDGKITTSSNHSGGLLGGMTTGMPLVIHLAMKPTPSIYKEQHSVDLNTMQDAALVIEGRHDPCIARRAVPVAEALTAFVLTDALMAEENATPRICLTLTEATLADDLAALQSSTPFVDMAELRVDCLSAEDQLQAAAFTSRVTIPVILTIRRTQDGGKWQKDETTRHDLYAKLLSDAQTPFEYVDFEDDFRHADLEQLARTRGTHIIRSLHDFQNPITNVVERCRELKGSSDDIPKIAFAVHRCSDVARLFKETADFTGFPHILCAMGLLGVSSRILAGRTHSLLTFTSPQSAVSRMSGIGHVTPELLVKTYGFRSLTKNTALYAVTGWPLEHTASPDLNNTAFFAAAQPAVMVPIPSETPSDFINCANILGIRGIAVTVPHKETVIPLLASIDETARAIGAVNTVVRTVAGWKGFNTDAAGFTAALLAFLNTDSIAGRKVAIIGAGGAARAIAYAIATLHGDACILNRTLDKAQALANLYGFNAATLTEDNAELLKEYADIVIQATSVGLGATDASADPIPFYTFNGTESVYDLVYSPAETPILTRARQAGCKTENGMSMLIEQAREQRRLYREYSGENC